MSFASGYNRDKENVGAEKKSADKTIPVKDRALGLLARREHSATELKRKLQLKGYAAADIDVGVSQLLQDGSLSDRRFTEAYVNMRMNRGYGPVRIMAELRDRGINADLADEYLNQDVCDWPAILRKHYNKKYAGHPITDYHEKSRRIGYLQARGFKLDWIFNLLGDESE